MKHCDYYVGDYVTRDGTDIHVVVSLTPDKYAGEFRCIKEPKEKWINLNETEYNLARRYQRLAIGIT